jgi:hypothetical protein
MNLLAVLAVACSIPMFGVGDERSPSDPSPIVQTGDVALDDWPNCDFFVVHTAHGFSLVLWHSGMWIFGEGDYVYGPANQIGRQSILLSGIVMSGQMTVEIEAVGVDLPDAQAAFYKRCKIS